MLAEYGKLAVVIYLIIFAGTLAGFAVAISYGVDPESTAGNVGILGAAWIAAKVTQPLRILATLALTPLVAAGLKKLRRRKPAPTDVGAPPAP